MRNLLLTIAYDGSAFHGWQVQKNALSVQEVFQNAIERVFGERLAIHGCSRTDTGVHANMFCVNLHTDMVIGDEGVIMAMNTCLPSEVAVIGCQQVEDSFHARYNCQSKQYVYLLYNGKIRSPFYDKYAHHDRRPIDVTALNEAAQSYVGTYDYAAFCAAGCKVSDTVRTVTSFSVHRVGELVYFTVEADGFLYNMVRIMVGTLLSIAQGCITATELPAIIASKQRQRAGKTAPPQGLYLNHVEYKEGVNHERCKTAGQNTK